MTASAGYLEEEKKMSANAIDDEMFAKRSVKKVVSRQIWLNQSDNVDKM